MLKNVLFCYVLLGSITAAYAGTCTDNSIPAGRYYADTVSKILTEDDLSTQFKVIKNGSESGWISFNSNSVAGKNNLSILLTSGAAAKKVSFYVVAGQCKGSNLNVDRLMIEF